MKSKDLQTNNDVNYVDRYKLLVNIVEQNLWHARLGHFVNKELENFVIKHIQNKHICKQCKINKMKRAKFDMSTNKTTNPLELIHSDVVGKLKISNSGFKFYVNFLDDYSRKCWVFTIKDDGTRKARLVIKRFKQIKGKDFIDCSLIF